MPSISLPVAVGGAALAGVAGSALSAGAASSAAGEQANAANNAAAAQTNQQNFTNGQLAPFVGPGQSATSQLANLTGANGAAASSNALSQYGLSGLTFQPTQAQLAATPGYQFDLAQGEQGVANSNAAQGRGISGAALKGAANYATGLANNTLTTQQGIFQQNLNNVLNPLANVANIGENAAAQNGQIGQASSASIGNDVVGAGNAAASGTVGSANAISGGLSSLGSAPLNSMLYSQLLGGGSGASGGSFDTGPY